MIDIENSIFTTIATALRERFDDITVSGEDVRTPSTFPFVSIVEADNYVRLNTQDSGSNENHANVMYEINVYSNKTSGKKAECKEILGVIDEILTGLNFSRTMKNPVSMDDATVYRLVGRYQASVSKNHTIYRR